MHVKPSTGLRIVDPLLRDFLPEDGRLVTPSDYWHRRLRDGDVVLTPAAAASEVSATPIPSPVQTEVSAKPAAARKRADQ